VATVRFYTRGVRIVHKTEHLSAVFGSIAPVTPSCCYRAKLPGRCRARKNPWVRITPRRSRAPGNLALLCYKQGKDRKAEIFFETLACDAERTLGPQHPHVATSLHNLALLYGNQGQYVKAEPLFQRALSIWEKAIGPEHPNVATCVKNYALLLGKMGRPNEAAVLDLALRQFRPKTPDYKSRDSVASRGRRQNREGRQD